MRTLKSAGDEIAFPSTLEYEELEGIRLFRAKFIFKNFMETNQHGAVVRNISAVPLGGRRELSGDPVTQSE